MADEVHREGLAPSATAAELRGGVDDPGLLIYERLLPALPASVARIRHELIESLTSHHLAGDRHADIAVVASEAATNAVLHAYLDTSPGPLYAAATLGGDSLTVWISDFGRGRLRRTDSPGLGQGTALMRRLCDNLQIDSDSNAPGTCVTATFAGMTRAAERPADRRPIPAPSSARREILVDYLHALRATNAALRQDTDAVLAQADLAVARARRQRRQRAEHR